MIITIAMTTKDELNRDSISVSMEKYRLINKTTNEEHICTKVVLDGFDYYVSDERIKNGDTTISGNTTLKFGWNWGFKKIQSDEEAENENELVELTKKVSESNKSLMFKKVITTNNPSIDLPQVIDNISNTAFMKGMGNIAYKEGYIDGYNNHDETNPNSDEDMIEFTNFCTSYCNKHGHKHTEELLNLWKSQQTKTIYYV